MWLDYVNVLATLCVNLFSIWELGRQWMEALPGGGSVISRRELFAADLSESDWECSGGFVRVQFICSVFFPTCQARVSTNFTKVQLIRLLLLLLVLLCQLRMLWGTPGPEHMSDRIPDRMPEWMPYRCQNTCHIECHPDRMPDRMSE